MRKGISSRLKIVMYSDVTGQELEFDYIGREKILKSIIWKKHLTAF